MIEFAENRSILDSLERKYIAEYRNITSRENFYNLMPGGGGCYDPSINTLEKMRISHLGKASPKKGRKYPSHCVQV